MLVPTFRRLEVFVAVAEAGSFAAAARRLGIAQPSVSAHVASIERECGLLFERRRGREPLLSAQGQTFLTHARSMLANASQWQDAIAPPASDARQKLAIACQRSIATAVLRNALTDFARDHRDLHPTVRVGHQEEVIAGLRKGEVDVGLLLGPVTIEGMPAQLIGRQRCIVYAHAAHPLAGRGRVSPREVADHAFVAPPAHSQFGRALQHLLASVGIAPLRIAAESTEFAMSRDFTAAGVGLGCSLLATVQADLDAGRLAVIDVDAPALYVDVLQVTHPRRVGLPAVAVFTQHLRAAGAHWD